MYKRTAQPDILKNALDISKAELIQTIWMPARWTCRELNAAFIPHSSPSRGKHRSRIIEVLCSENHSETTFVMVDSVDPECSSPETLAMLKRCGVPRAHLLPRGIHDPATPLHLSSVSTVLKFVGRYQSSSILGLLAKINL